MLSQSSSHVPPCLPAGWTWPSPTCRQTQACNPGVLLSGWWSSPVLVRLQHHASGEGRRVTVCFAKIDQKLIPWAAQQGKNKYDKYLESLPLWRRLKNNYHNWTAMFVFSCLNMSKGQLIWNEHFINTANIEVCTWGAGKLYFCFFLYCTARQQTFPESHLLEAWPASIYGHLREWIWKPCSWRCHSEPCSQ